MNFLKPCHRRVAAWERSTHQFIQTNVIRQSTVTTNKSELTTGSARCDPGTCGAREGSRHHKDTPGIQKYRKSQWIRRYAYANNASANANLLCTQTSNRWATRTVAAESAYFKAQTSRKVLSAFTRKMTVSSAGKCDDGSETQTC